LVWIDVATQNSVGTPEMGGMTGVVGRMMSGTNNDVRYPTARGNAGTDSARQFLDVTLYNKLKPGMESQSHNCDA
jgi:hypothetical protein